MTSDPRNTNRCRAAMTVQLHNGAEPVAAFVPHAFHDTLHLYTGPNAQLKTAITYVINLSSGV